MKFKFYAHCFFFIYPYKCLRGIVPEGKLQFNPDADELVHSHCITVKNI